MRRGNWFSIILGLALIAVPIDAFAKPRSRPRPSRPAARAPKAPAPKSPKATPRRGAASKKTSTATPTKKADQKRGKATGKSANKGWGDSKKKAGKSKKVTKADQKAYDRAKASGKTAPNRKAAMTKFRNDPKNAKKYTSSYATKPSSRPGHIPPSYSYNGRSVPIVYVAGRGYGHMDTLGTLIMYDAMRYNTGYMNTQMANAGYMYGPRPVIVSSGFGYGWVALLVIAIVVVVVIATGRCASRD